MRYKESITRKYSSRMRTVRALKRMSSDQVAMRPIVSRMTDRHLWKHYFPLQSVNIEATVNCNGVIGFNYFLLITCSYKNQERKILKKLIIYQEDKNFIWVTRWTVYAKLKPFDSFEWCQIQFQYILNKLTFSIILVKTSMNSSTNCSLLLASSLTMDSPGEPGHLRTSSPHVDSPFSSTALWHMW